MDQEHQQNKPNKGHSEKTELNNVGLRSEGTVLENEHIQKNIPTLCNLWTNNIYTQLPPCNYTWQKANYQRICQDPVSEFFLNKRTQKCARGLQQERFSILQTTQNQDPPTWVHFFFQKSAHHSEYFFRTGIFKQHKDSGPSNFLFQIARGSGATLSECTFSLKKRTSQKRLLQGKPLQDLKTKRTRNEPYLSSFWPSTNK